MYYLFPPTLIIGIVTMMIESDLNENYKQVKIDNTKNCISFMTLRHCRELIIASLMERIMTYCLQLFLLNSL